MSMAEINIQGREIVAIQEKIYATEETRLDFISFVVGNFPTVALDFIEKGGLDRVTGTSDGLATHTHLQIPGLRPLVR
jgi:hypothetical protein